MSFRVLPDLSPVWVSTRQFFSKQTNFRIVQPEELEKAVNLINNRPRKSLDYRTPFEVFYADRSDAVALQI